MLHFVGFLGMVAMFLAWNMKQVGHFGLVLAAGVGLFIYNMVCTLARVPRWNVVAFGIATALGWLAVTVLAGLFLASAKCWPRLVFYQPIAAMHAHAHLGGLGFFVLNIGKVLQHLVRPRLGPLIPSEAWSQTEVKVQA